ncbi:MAG TPA: hypothetical protein VFR09_06180 [Alphaproteobacteria bacterium]|nr:hypothetical protein [Alphaproteobacteria bacterium]
MFNKNAFIAAAISAAAVVPGTTHSEVASAELPVTSHLLNGFDALGVPKIICADNPQAFPTVYILVKDELSKSPPFIVKIQKANQATHVTGKHGEDFHFANTAQRTRFMAATVPILEGARRMCG